MQWRFKGPFHHRILNVTPKHPTAPMVQIKPLEKNKVNLLRRYHINTQLSSEEILIGTCDYNKMTEVPPIRKWIEKKVNQKTWNTHGVERLHV